MSYLDVSAYMITGENPKDIESFLKRVINCLKQGISLFQFRAHQLSEVEYIYLAKKHGAIGMAAISALWNDIS
jgi:thiamine monophosphate synthase